MLAMIVESWEQLLRSVQCEAQCVCRTRTKELTE